MENKIYWIVSETLKRADKKAVAEELGITQTALSKQLKNLKEKNSINIKTIFAIEKVTGKKIFNLQIPF